MLKGYFWSSTVMIITPRPSNSAYLIHWSVIVVHNLDTWTCLVWVCDKIAVMGRLFDSRLFSKFDALADMAQHSESRL